MLSSLHSLNANSFCKPAGLFERLNVGAGETSELHRLSDSELHCLKDDVLHASLPWPLTRLALLKEPSDVWPSITISVGGGENKFGGIEFEAAMAVPMPFANGITSGDGAGDERECCCRAL